MYTNTDSTTSGTFTHTRASTNSTYYGYLRGFNFSDVPSDATVSSFTIKIKASATGHTTSTSTSYYMSLYNNTSAISNTNASGRLTTSTTTFTFAIPSSLTWETLKGYGANFGIRIPLRRSSSNTADVVSVYGAEIEVNYTIPTPVSVTGVSLDKSTDSVETGATTTLTATVSPNDASNKTVSWSTSNSSVATVSNGVVTGVSPGSAIITVTTTDGGYTDTCTVTVTAATMYDYVPASSMQVGKSYLITIGNSGTVPILTDESGGSRTLVGVTTTVSNGKISINGATKSRTLFACVRYTSGNDATITVEKDGKYLYCDNSTGLRMNAPATLDRFWHYRDNKFWQFKSTSSDGYSDTSSEYKYYLQASGNNFTDNHVTSPSIEDSTLPLIYIWREDNGETDELYVKSNGSWVSVANAYKKINGSWVLQDDLTTVFSSGTNYIRG